MANKFRYISGDTNPVITGDTPADNVIEIGDFVSVGPTALDVPANAQNFLGVSGQQSLEGDTAPIRVSTAGDYEHACIPATFQVGDMVGISGRKTLVKVTDPAFAIGRAAKAYPTATNVVIWRVMSRAMAQV